MRAIVIDGFGGVEHLVIIPEPEPPSGWPQLTNPKAVRQIGV